MDLLNQGSLTRTQDGTGSTTESFSFAEHLRARAETSPESLAYLFIHSDGRESKLSNRDLFNRVKSLSEYLTYNNFRDNTVILSYPPGLDFVVGFFATIAAGAVAVPVPLLQRKDRNQRNVAIIRDSGARNLLSTSECIDRLRTQNLLDPDFQYLATNTIPGNDNPSDAPLPTIRRDKLAAIQYTSGSTRAPKGVMLTHRNLLHNCEMISQALQIHSGDRGLSWLPPHHDMGLVGGILAPFVAGISTVLMSPACFYRNPVTWLQLIEKHGVTISGGPDFGYRHCIDRIDEEVIGGINLENWRSAYVGAEPIRADTLRRFAEKFGKSGFASKSFFPCYGLAEATLIVSGGPLHELRVERFKTSALGQDVVVPSDESASDVSELVASGEILPDVSVKIVNSDTLREVENGGVGEIWISSSSVASGYLNSTNATTETFEATIHGAPWKTPFLRTGDTGFLRNGELFVTGRLKDLIIVRGVNHYPQDLESTCESATEYVQRSAVVAFSTEINNQEHLAIVAEAKRGGTPEWGKELSRIRASLTGRHDLDPVAIQIVPPASLPRTPSGKLRRLECRRLFEKHSLKAITSWTNEDVTTISDPDTDLGKTVLKLLSDNCNVETPLDPSIRLADVGIDSASRLNLIHVVEKEFSIRFSELSLRSVDTISDLVNEALRQIEQKPAQTSSVETSDRSTTRESIPSAHFRFEEFPEISNLNQIRRSLSDTGSTDPYFAVCEGVSRETIRIEGRDVVNFASYNYLGLSGREEVSEAAVAAIERFGTSSGASRLVSGNREVHETLESTLAEFVGTEAAITFVSGHSTNETVIGHLFGPGDLILFDSHSHNSITQGAELSGAHRRPFPHNSPESVDQILAETRSRYRRVLIVTEGLFGIDGDVPKLREFVEIKERHRCLLMIDEAHSLGTLGQSGRGITEHCGVAPVEVDLIMGTLSKSLASCGGFIAGKQVLIDYLRYSAPGFVFSVGMPPASAAAALAAIRIIDREPELVSRLQERSRFFHHSAATRDITTSSQPGSPVFSLDLKSPHDALEVSRRLLERGVNAPPILYPAVSENSGKIRFFTCAYHTDEQIDLALDSLADILRESSFPG